VFRFVRWVSMQDERAQCFRTERKKGRVGFYSLMTTEGALCQRNKEKENAD